MNSPAQLPTAPTLAVGTLDVSHVTAEEAAAVRHYLEAPGRSSRRIFAVRSPRRWPSGCDRRSAELRNDLRGERFLIAVVDAKLGQRTPE